MNQLSAPTFPRIQSKADPQVRPTNGNFVRIADLDARATNGRSEPKISSPAGGAATNEIKVNL